MMIVSVDPARAGDGELAEGERERLTRLSARFSREDLMRAFDLLGKAEQEIRNSSQPRYYFEMVLLRWMHLRKLVPLVDLLEGGTAVGPKAAPVGPKLSNVGPKASPVGPGPTSAKRDGPASVSPGRKSDSSGPSDVKDRFLAEVRSGKAFFYNTVVAQAQRIEVAADRITFSFLPAHRALREQFEQTKGWLEAAAERVAGRRVGVVAVQSEAPSPADSAPDRRLVRRRHRARHQRHGGQVLLSLARRLPHLPRHGRAPDVAPRRLVWKALR
jgi:DNA polymerase III gamma/tau subunit